MLPVRDGASGHIDRELAALRGATSARGATHLRADECRLGTVRHERLEDGEHPRDDLLRGPPKVLWRAPDRLEIVPRRVRMCLPERGRKVTRALAHRHYPIGHAGLILGAVHERLLRVPSERVDELPGLDELEHDLRLARGHSGHGRNGSAAAAGNRPVAAVV